MSGNLPFEPVRQRPLTAPTGEVMASLGVVDPLATRAPNSMALAGLHTCTGADGPSPKLEPGDSFRYSRDDELGLIP